MLNPAHQRNAERIQKLIDDGKAIEQSKQPYRADSGFGDYTAFTFPDIVKFQAWLTKVEAMLVGVFGNDGIHYQQFNKISPKMDAASLVPWQINLIVGILSGALDDLQNGYLVGQTFLIAAEVFDSVLEQAKHLNGEGYKDPAAVLARVVLEDALRRLARQNSIDDTGRAAGVNDRLKAANIYPQPQWRLVQAWLDVGNESAHGNFASCTKEDVTRQIEGVETFLATHFVA